LQQILNNLKEGSELYLDLSCVLEKIKIKIENIDYGIKQIK